MKASFLLILLALTRFAAAATTTPQKMTYPGLLSSQSLPTNGEIGMNFTFYVDSAGGVPSWSSGDQTVSITNGIVKVILGETGNEISSVTVRAGSSLYIETAVEGAVFSPRNEIVSAPYALKTASVEGIRVTPEGNLGLGVPRDPTIKLQLRGGGIALATTTAPPSTPSHTAHLFLDTTGMPACLGQASRLYLKMIIQGPTGGAVTNVLGYSECF